MDPNVQVSTDRVNWSPAYTANIGYPTPLVGSNWDFPSADPFAGYGNPQTIYYQVTFVLPAGAASPSLSGMMSADDQVQSVSLNGATFYTNPYEGFVYDPSPHSFSTGDSSLFQVGTNILVFAALNLGGQTAADFTATVSFQGGPFPPSASAGGPYSTIIDQSASLDGSQSYDFNSPPQPLQYVWSETSSPSGSNGGQLTKANAAVATFVPDVPGTYTFNLSVTDSFGQTSSSTATVVALEIPPVADAGGPYSVTTGQTVTLDGTNSTDPNDPPQPLTFTWLVTSAPAGSNGGDLINADSATPSFTPDVPGTFTIGLTVTNSTGETETASATITSDAQQVASNGGKCTGYCQVAAGSSVTGNITVTTGGTLEVDGIVKGNVNVNSGAVVNVIGVVKGSVRASTNSNVQISGTVSGNVRVAAGDTLVTNGAQVGGHLWATGAASATLNGGSVAGNLRLSGVGAVGINGVSVSGNLRIIGTTGAAPGGNYVCNATVGGNLNLHQSGPNAPFLLGTCGPNTISKTLYIEMNQAPVTSQSETATTANILQNETTVTTQGDAVSKNMNASNNLSLTVQSDTISNSLTVNGNQTATVESDLIQRNLSCTGNASITALGDTINGKALGQCKDAAQPLPPPPNPCPSCI